MYKIKRTHIYLTVFAIILIESVILPRAELAGVRPDLLLISILFFSLFSERASAIEAALAGGILRDLLTVGPFGIHTLLFGAAAWMVSFYSDKIYKEFFLTQVVLAAVAGVSVYAGYFFLRFVILNRGIEYLGNGLSGTIIPSVLYTSLLAPVVFFALSRIFRAKICE